MAYWDEFMEEDEKAEVKEEKEEIIKPAVIKHIPIRHKEPVIRTETLTREEIKLYIREILKEEEIGKTQKIVVKNYDLILDNWEQLKTYFRKGKRPSQTTAIKNFEKHLKKLIKEPIKYE